MTSPSLFPPPDKRAFSLVELSIVLVVLGLLVGGVLSGRELIHASKLRKLTTQYQQLRTAVSSFKEKYFYLPGDMPNATQFWGASPSCGTSTGNYDPPTCNGDGDGVPGLGAGSLESKEAWKHLSNANLIEGQYLGRSGSLGAGVSPANTFSGNNNSLTGYWAFTSLGATIYNPAVDYGVSFDSNSGQTPTGLIKPEDVYNIDMKIDDGKPGIGKVIVSGRANYCTTSAGMFYPAVSALPSIDYLFTTTTNSCAPVFRQQF